MSKTLYPLLSSGSTQEDLVIRTDMAKNVDWDVKDQNQTKTNNKLLLHRAGSFERGPRPEKQPKQRQMRNTKDNVVGKETVPTQASLAQYLPYLHLTLYAG